MRYLPGAVLALLAPAVIAAFLARYVPPERAFWLQPLGTALPFLALLVPLALVLSLVLGRTGAAAVSGGLLLLVAVRFVPPLAVWAPAEAAGEHLRVTTYNASFRYPPPIPPSGDTLEAVQAALVPLMRPRTAHLLALQERRLHYPIARTMRTPGGGDAYLNHPFILGLLRESPLRHASVAEDDAYEVPPPSNAPGDYMNPVLAADVAIEAVTQVHRTEPADPRIPPLATKVVFRWQGRRAALYNVHLHSFEVKPWAVPRRALLRPGTWVRLAREARSDYVRRSAEAARLRQLLDEEPLPFIVAGDFNSTPHNWAYGRVAEGLTDAAEATGPAWRRTFPMHRPLIRIDHVLLSPGWRAVRVETDPVRLSDHVPLTASVAWAGSPAPGPASALASPAAGR